MQCLYRRYVKIVPYCAEKKIKKFIFSAKNGTQKGFNALGGAFLYKFVFSSLVPGNSNQFRAIMY